MKYSVMVMYWSGIIPFVAERMNLPSSGSVSSARYVFKNADGAATRMISQFLTTSFRSDVAWMNFVSKSRSLRYFIFLPSLISPSSTSSFRMCHHISLLFFSKVWTRAVAQLPYPMTPHLELSLILYDMIFLLNSLRNYELFRFIQNMHVCGIFKTGRLGNPGLPVLMMFTALRLYHECSDECKDRIELRECYETIETLCCRHG